MGFEIGVAQPSVDRTLADPPDEVPLHRGPSEWPNRPVGASAPQLGAGATRHGQDIMTFRIRRPSLDAIADRPEKFDGVGASAQSVMSPWFPMPELTHAPLLPPW
jgi:hypothetical protein